ncbi:unnamed protein product [Closterium sp. NIES-65]|nr:unnamed protein product [Closterium sp. NIES-65]
MSDYVLLAAQARVNLTGDATTPAGVRPTTIPAVTLRLIYDLDALAKIPVDPDIPPPPVGDPQKRRPSQPEEDSSSSDEEEEPQPGAGRQRRPLTRAKRDRREIEEALTEDELEDRLNASALRGEFTTAEFVVEDLKNSDIEVLIVNALRHTEMLEEGSSLRQYISWILDYKRWAVDALPSQGDDMKPGSILTYKDEIGKHIGDDLGERWHTAPRQFIWLHDQRTNEPRIRAYVLFRARETLIEAMRSEEGNTAMRTQPIKPCTVNMLLGRKALPMAAKIEATLYKEKELYIMQDISVVRTEVRVMVRRKNKTDTNVREIMLADIFLYRLASGSSMNPDNRPMVMVIAQRNSKTCKDGRLHHIYAARHLEAELCAVGDTILWLHFIYDQAEELAQGPGTNTAAVLFIQTMLDARRIAAEDLAAWAKDIQKIDTETIAKRRSPIPTQPASQPAWTPDFQVDLLNETLAHERHKATLKQMKVEKELEEARAAIAARDAEISRLMEELKISEARRAPAPQAPSRPTTLEEEAAAAAKKAQLDADAHYEALVVDPWRKAETVAEAWRFWNCPTTTDRRRLYDRINEPSFIGRHSLLGKSSANAKQGEMRRMRRAMEAVRRFRSSDGEADTAAVIKKLDELAASGIVTFYDALKIIDADALPICTEGNLGIKGLSEGEKPKLTVAWGLVAAGYMTHKWGEDMFPTTWEEQKAVAAQAAAEQVAGRPPPLPTKTSKHRKPG